jgi:hypothetical protein
MISSFEAHYLANLVPGESDSKLNETKIRLREWIPDGNVRGGGIICPLSH